MTNDRASQIKEVNSQRQKQNEQGVNHRLGKKNRVVKTEGVKGSPVRHQLNLKFRII